MPSAYKAQAVPAFAVMSRAGVQVSRQPQSPALPYGHVNMRGHVSRHHDVYHVSATLPPPGAPSSSAASPGSHSGSRHFAAVTALGIPGFPILFCSLRQQGDLAALGRPVAGLTPGNSPCFIASLKTGVLSLR